MLITSPYMEVGSGKGEERGDFGPLVASVAPDLRHHLQMTVIGSVAIKITRMAASFPHEPPTQSQEEPPKDG